MQMTESRKRISAACLSLFCSVGTIFLTGLIPGWGLWYSDHLSYRWQVERLLHGHLGMAPDPSGMAWDLAWGDGAVQQVWGLGIPFWRLPFEVLATTIGQPAFPDRLEFFIALAGVAYVICRFHFCLSSDICRGPHPYYNWLGLCPTILFPPFIALCSSRFLVYEEAVAYAFLMGLLLMTWTAWLWLRPTLKRFYGLALVSGLIMLIRPTFGAYAVASFVLGCIAVWRSSRRVNPLILGAVLFSFGIGLLLAFNRLRFGSCLEFGYSLNVNEISPMVYAQRFGNPYHDVAIGTAAKELFGMLFLTSSFSPPPDYGFDLFPLQSHTFRWREVYFSTYDVTIFAMLIIALGWLTWRLAYRCKQRRFFDDLNCLEVVAMWSAMAMVPLTAFYLKFPFLSSRYLLDFGPAFSAALWVFFGLLLRLAASYKESGLWLEALVCGLLLVWTGSGIASNRVKEEGHPIDQRELIARMQADEGQPMHKPIPLCYTNGFGFNELGIPYNGVGWDSNIANTEACVIVYVQNPECLVLDVTSTNTAPAPISAFNCIRAKIGTEFLQRMSIEPSLSGVRITFSGPKAKRYQTGIQQAAIAMVAPDELTDNGSGFCLLKVGWHLAKKEGK